MTCALAEYARRVTEDQFWTVIGAIDNPAAMNEDRESEIADGIAGRLRPHGVEALSAFEEHLAEKLYRIDTRAHCDAGGDASNSSDGFLYARCFVVACGREVYEAVATDPRQMPTRSDQWLEPLLFVGANVHAELTGNDIEDWQPETRFDYETGSNRDGWPEQ